MSKRNSDADVLANRTSVVLARNQRLLSSWLRPAADSEPTNSSRKGDDEEEELQRNSADPEQLGIGAMAPKDDEDSSFTKRVPTSNDKLLAQLIGAKAAKAHIVAKQQAANKSHTQQQQNKYRIAHKKEESEDEEGRAATFKSKRRRTSKSTVVTTDQDHRTIKESREGPNAGLLMQFTGNRGAQVGANADLPANGKETRTSEQGDGDGPRSTSQPGQGKAKPRSFLDEILAERSSKTKKKKKKKKKNGS